MKRFEEREHKIVTRKECIELTCDCCGRKAEQPTPDPCDSFEWNRVGLAGGQLIQQTIIDGDFDRDEYDLCPDCVEFLIAVLQKHKLEKSKK